MKTDALETRLREVLHERASQVTESDLSHPDLGGPSRHALVRRSHPAYGRSLTAAAAVLLVLGLVAAGLVGRNSDDRIETPVLEGALSGGVPLVEESPPRAWPLSNDEPLAAGGRDIRFSDSEAAARAYLTEVVGLPADWPMEPAGEQGRYAAATYELQDVPARLGLAADADGLWYVVNAMTELVDVGAPDAFGGGHLKMPISGGSRAHEDMQVKLSVLAADGRVLTTEGTRVQPKVESQEAAPVVSLEWPGIEFPAAVRADVLSDHDADPSTPDITVGHWSQGVMAPSLLSLPAAVDVANAEPVFTGSGSLDMVARAYMQDRLPDGTESGFDLVPFGTRGHRGYVGWGAGGSVSADEPKDGRPLPIEHQAEGMLALRQVDGGWAVIAATTYGVDLLAVSVKEGRLTGRITTDNPNLLMADVLTSDGEPVARAPLPEGQPDAAYRIGTAGGPSDGSLDLDVPVDPGTVVLQVRLVGGTVLSISEVRITVPAP